MKGSVDKRKQLSPLMGQKDSEGRWCWDHLAGVSPVAVGVHLVRRVHQKACPGLGPQCRRAPAGVTRLPLCCLVTPSGRRARARVRISTASHPCLCVSCLTVVFPGEVRPLSVSSAPQACPDVWVSRPPLQLGLFPVNLGKGPASQMTREAEHFQLLPALCACVYTDAQT